MAKSSNSGVFQLENGNWGYRFIVKSNERRKAQKRIRDELGKPFKTEKQAIKARQKAIAMEKEKLLLPPQKKIVRRTIAEVYKEYCEIGRLDKAYSTNKKQDSLWNNYLLERFGKRFVDDISVGEVNDYLTELYCVNHLAYGYVEAFLKQFYLIFGQAYARNYMYLDDYNKLCVNKNGRIKMPNMKSTDVKEIVAYSKEEFKKLDKYFKGKPVETAYMIGKHTGLRLAECYGLTWDCVDFEKGVLLVEKQLKMENGLVKLKPLKTINAKRKVYMNDEIQEYLLDLKIQTNKFCKIYSEQRKQNEIIIRNIDGRMVSSLMLVNTQPNGRIQTEWAIKHHAKPIKEKYNIHFKFHNLRHSYGTRLALLNTPVHILTNQMGHSKSSTTYKYYLAISDEAIDILKSNLNKI